MADRFGPCRGGPLDGRPLHAPEGEPFLATDRADGRVRVHRWDGDASWVVCTAHDSTLVLPEGSQTGERTLSWDRLDASPLHEVPVVDVEENHAGRPVDDGWDVPPPMRAEG